MSYIPNKFGAEHYRSFLTPQGKECYDRILFQLQKGDYSGETSLTVREPATAASDCFAAYKAIRDDHPEFFFLGFQSEFTRIGTTGRLKYPILYSADIIRRVQLQTLKSICSLVRGTADLPEIEKEITVYGRIARKLSYNNHGDVRDHNIVGPVLYNEGVCEGHNALLLLCLRRLGIPCIKVYGKTKSDGWHCWTVAWINGTPVHCDVTWDVADENTGLVCFNYLNLSDRQISKDHFEFCNTQVPICSCEALTYHRRRGLCVGSSAELVKRLEQDINAASASLIHLSYTPAKGDLVSEVKRAFRKSRLYGSISIQASPNLSNVLVWKT